MGGLIFSEGTSCGDTFCFDDSLHDKERSPSARGITQAEVKAAQNRFQCIGQWQFTGFFWSWLSGFSWIEDSLPLLRKGAPMLQDFFSLDCPVCRDLLKRKLGFHRYEDCFVIFCLF
jgi:hypothetical protein